jgi:pimeloyl-ACP methyl ester carboxylesterase
MGDIPVSQATVTANGLEFAYLEAGTGPLALCLHGFPDTAWGWEPLLGALAGAGYHAVAPFMRGYAPTAVPADGSSALGAWVADAAALHDVLGGGADAVLIGHDWGALTTYGAAATGADRWRRIVTASIPPSSVMAGRLLDYDQLKMFWYQYVFLQPTAEMIVANDDLAFIGHIWDDWSPGFDHTTAVARVKDALREPANLTAALSTYRTMYGVQDVPVEFAELQFSPFVPHSQPTLYLHGANDGCVPADVVLGLTLDVLPAGSNAELITDAGHFLQYEQPDRVNRLILDFLTT